MSDQTTIPAAAVPEPLTIPQSLLEKWFDVPAASFVQVAFTRGDWDTLFSSLNNNLLAQNSLDQALVDWTNGRTDEANGALNEARRLRGESGNALRRFFLQIMASAKSAHQS